MGFDLCSVTYNFAFNPSVVGPLSSAKLEGWEDPFLQQLFGEVANFATFTQTHCNDLDRAVMMDEFRTLFTASLGMTKCTPYDFELSDVTPVRSPPYRCAPPKLQIFK
jgi:hypothetical protein